MVDIYLFIFLLIKEKVVKIVTQVKEMKLKIFNILILK